jgi:hypothetical protein
MTEKKVKEPVEHRDRIGRVIKVGDCVAYPSSNNLHIGMVKKLNPKMVGVAKVSKERRPGYGNHNKYPSDIVVLDGPEVVMYLLKNSG